MLLIVLWIFFAICCAILASNKGRSVVLWLVLGILFSFFALILLAVLAPVPRAPVRSALSPAEARVACPECGDMCLVSQTSCGRCGTPMETDIFQKVAADQAQQKNKAGVEIILLPLMLLIVLAMIYQSIT